MACMDSEIEILESPSLPLSNDPTLTRELHRTTLARRAKGQIMTREEYRQKNGLLTEQQEEVLLEHINDLTLRGFPPAPRHIKALASRISGKTPGKNWVSNFKRRHADQIASDFLDPLDSSRNSADSWLKVKKYFDLLQKKWEKYQFEPQNVYNMDEKGFLIGVTQKSRRIFTKKWKESGKLIGHTQDGSRTWISLIATICADGTSLPPVLIYPSLSGDLQESWLQDYDPGDGTYFAASESGWTSNEIALKWLTKLFDRHSKHKARQGRDPRLLFVDGHGSHINMEFINECEKRNIIVCAYPPHSTHRLQALDVSLFSPLSTYYSQRLDDWMMAGRGFANIDRHHFYKLFKPAYDQAFSEANIQSAFRKTGILPLDPEVVLRTLSTRPADSSTAMTSSLDSMSFSATSESLPRRSNTPGSSTSTFEYRALLRAYQKTVAESTLKDMEIEGLKTLLADRKARKPRKKAPLDELRNEEEGGALFLSPTKYAAARELQAEREREEELVQATRAQIRKEKELEKQRKAQEKAAAAAARLEQREKRAQEKASRQAQKEEAIAQRLASLQLASELRTTGNSPEKSPRKTQHHTARTVDLIEHRVEPVVSAQPMQTSTSGRQLRKPRHLDDYET
jgi:hypothetical protein